MKKSILNLGKALNKAEQKHVYGGGAVLTHLDPFCQNSSEVNYIIGCPCVPGTELTIRVLEKNGLGIEYHTCE